ncbi:MAG: alpha-ketoglutarate-dependent dioxygenase AlkB [Myxococcota bacterium]
MRGPTPSAQPSVGDLPIRESGFTYLPRFFGAQETLDLAAYFAGLHPQWERRHAHGSAESGRRPGSLTRPVYWLGAWQFAALGYYSEPEHVHHKCVAAEPIPDVLMSILQRLKPELQAHGDTRLPNTCLINFYGQTCKAPGKPPVDMARLRMHRDGEPGPVIMLSVGQPAQFEFVDPDVSEPVHSQWIRNRSAVILSGPEYKDRLYHRVTRVRYGDKPVLTANVDDFQIRRVSISFRHVPPERIHDFGALNAEARDVVRPYVEQLAQNSSHFRRQLLTESEESRQFEWRPR